MDFNMNDLVKGAIGRKGIGRQVAIARAIAEVNVLVKAALPPHRQDDARAISLTNGLLIIGCRNGAAARLVRMQESRLIETAKAHAPSERLDRLTTRISRDLDADVLC